MNSIFDGLTLDLDQNNPDDALIISQREKYFNWQETIKKFAPSESLKPDFEINPVLIYESYNISRTGLATIPTSSPLLEKVQNCLMEIYNRRNLHFPEKDIFAIADPDETDLSHKRAAYQGILHFLSFGYDLRVPVILEKESDGRDFDFFFALRLLDVPVMELDGFLDFQLAESFDGDFEKFSRFLNLMPRYVSSEFNILKLEGFAMETVPEINATIKEWVEIKSKIGTQNSIQKLGTQNFDTAEPDPVQANPKIEHKEYPIENEVKPLQEDINSGQFCRALNAFKAIKNKAGQCVISEIDLTNLKKQGANIAHSGDCPKINLDLKRALLHEYLTIKY